MSDAFWVADLNAQGELRLKAEYRYDVLLMLPEAEVMIAEFATFLWRDGEEFELPLPAAPALALRWRSVADSAGIATLRHRGSLASLSLLASGLDQQSDVLTLSAFQTHLVRELHDTGYEPAFDLLDLPERPLVASVHFQAPEATQERKAFALADRCFAAAYFRYLRAI